MNIFKTLDFKGNISDMYANFSTTPLKNETVLLYSTLWRHLVFDCSQSSEQGWGMEPHPPGGDWSPML